jgi:DNA-binding response OmpR family regulator
MPDEALDGALRVLLVEDDPALAAMYRIKLRADGYHVEVAADGPSGLEAVLERTPHLLLLDIRLPGFDGLELLRRLREEGHADLPVIVLSNYEDQEMIERGARLGALAHLIKAQTTPASLAERIRSVLPEPAVNPVQR